MPEYQPGKIYDIPLEKVSENPNQPRKFFDEEQIAALASSIKKDGLLQPILVAQRKDDSDDMIVIVSGERRFRAHKILEKETIQACFTSGYIDELALVENLLREDLTPLETAEALENLKMKQNYSEEELGNIVGKAKSTISEILSLNKLSEEVKAEIRQSNKYALRELKQMAKRKDPHVQQELFEKYKKRVSGLEKRSRTTGIELDLKKIGEIQAYLESLRVSDERMKELASHREVLDSVCETTNKIICKIDGLK